MITPIKIFIGTEPKTYIPLQVLKYSIQKHTTAQIEFHELGGTSWKELKDAPLQSGTGFSLLRWTIPEKCNFEGFAIYLDVDMICLTDIQELWQLTSKLDNTSIACTYQRDKWFEKAPASSMMLINNQLAQTQWKYHTSRQITEHLKIDEKRKKYIALMHAAYCIPAPLEININWNNFNKRQAGCKILHYTEEPKQPWYYPKHDEYPLWRDYLVETLEAGMIDKETMEREINRFTPASGCCRAEGLNPHYKKFLRYCMN